jgi:hypothetical protein
LPLGDSIGLVLLGLPAVGLIVVGDLVGEKLVEVDVGDDQRIRHVEEVVVIGGSCI